MKLSLHTNDCAYAEILGWHGFSFETSHHVPSITAWVEAREKYPEQKSDAIYGFAEADRILRREAERRVA